MTYDVELSKQLLAEAGYPDGLTLTLNTTQERPIYYSIAQVLQGLQGQLAKAGITVELITTDYATMVETVNTNHDYQLNVNMYSLLAQDNATFMPQLCHSEQISTQTNYAEYTATLKSTSCSTRRREPPAMKRWPRPMRSLRRSSVTTLRTSRCMPTTPMLLPMHT